MKIETKSLVCILIVVTMIGCAKKGMDFCGTPALMNRPTFESKELACKTVGVADTTVAFVTGLVLGKDSADRIVSIDTLSYTYVSFKNLETSDSISTIVGADGKFEQHLKAGSYNIQFSMIGYNKLKIENIRFGEGEIKELNVMLGIGWNKTYRVDGRSFEKN